METVPLSSVLARLHLIEERLKTLENQGTTTNAQALIYDALETYVESKRRYPKDLTELRPYLPLSNEWDTTYEPVFENMKRQLKHKRSRHHREMTSEPPPPEDD